jgi:hypothetical protein
MACFLVEWGNWGGERRCFSPDGSAPRLLGW